MSDLYKAGPKPIGGYFEFAQNDRFDTPLYPNALAFQSARSAFLAILQHRKPRRVWVPDYGCGSMLEPLLAADIPMCKYKISHQLRILEEVSLAEDEIILVVNYFGLSGALIDEALSIFPPMQVVIDNAQALFAPPRFCLANIYSPRKFVGVADGGYLVSDAAFCAPVVEDLESAQHQEQLLIRMQQGPEAGYALYLKAENRLKINPDDLTVKAISVVTNASLRKFDYQTIVDVRRTNFASLHAWLQPLNALPIAPKFDDVPLCYPFIPIHCAALRLAAYCSEIRAKLAIERIYVATYWPELLPHSIDAGTISAGPELAKHIIALPIDQRLSNEDILRLKSVLAGLLER